MAVDSATKRYSLIGLALPAPMLMAPPSGTVNKAARSVLVRVYSGLVAQIASIREGDILVVDEDEYPIRALEEWTYWTYGRRGIERLLRLTVSTKRVPAISGGKRGTPTTQLTGLSCMPLDPVDPELRQRLAINTPHELLQTVVDGGSTFYRLILEDLKN